MWILYGKPGKEEILVEPQRSKKENKSEEASKAEEKLQKPSGKKYDFRIHSWYVNLKT